MSRRIGHKMRAAAWYVANNPGCSRRECAHYVSPLADPVCNEGLGYDIVKRAVRAGLIVTRPDPRRADWRVLYPAGQP